MRPALWDPCYSTGSQVRALAVMLAIMYDGMHAFFSIVHFLSYNPLNFIRLSWVPLLVLVSEEFDISTMGRGAILSAFPLGYLCTQMVS